MPGRLGGRLRSCPRASPGDADAASSRDGAEPAGKPAVPVSRAWSPDGWWLPIGVSVAYEAHQCPSHDLAGRLTSRMPERLRGDQWHSEADAEAYADLQPGRHRQGSVPVHQPPHAVAV